MANDEAFASAGEKSESGSRHRNHIYLDGHVSRGLDLNFLPATLSVDQFCPHKTPSTAITVGIAVEKSSIFELQNITCTYRIDI